ncbi:hypothetical protein CANINC_003017, partial [Pichia inconspicua]
SKFNDNNSNLIPITNNTPTTATTAAATTAAATTTATTTTTPDKSNTVSRPKITTTMWEDEKTLCYQVECNAEKKRQVVKIGSMHLKGVWIPFERAYLMAKKEGIDQLLYPLFIKDIQQIIRQGQQERKRQVQLQGQQDHQRMLSLSQQQQQQDHQRLLSQQLPQ